MDLGWEHYHHFNVILLSAIGLWPYEHTLVLRFKRFIGGLFSSCTCFAQLATFLTVDYTRALFLKNVPFIFVGCSTMLKYMSFLAASDSIKRVTETINDDWKNLSNKQEIRIVEKYVERSKFYTKGFAFTIWPTGLCLMLLQVYPVVLDVVMPLNGSRSRSFPIMFELFFDQQKHYLMATILFEVAVVIAGLVFVTTEALLMVYIQHACVLFEATSRRIKDLSYSTQIKKPKSISTEAIAHVVEMHSRAIRYCNMMREVFFPPYLVLIVFGILSLGAHLCRCTQTLATHAYTEFLASISYSLTILSYMFYISVVMQRLQNISGDIFDVLYNIEWYTFPTSTQKLLLFCMLKSMKPVAVDIHNLFFLSLEGFCLIMKMVMSYVTALYAIQ